MKQLITNSNSPVHLAEPMPQLLDFEPVADDVRAEVIEGLARPRKTLPCKLFYDGRGSQLFDQICELREYYPTRTELQVMREHASDMAAAIGPDVRLVEYGSGSSLKTRVLLDHLQDLASYVPIDISRTHLMQAATALASRYPHFAVQPVCADYTRPFSLPSCDDVSPAGTVAYFPGSTIGNFEPDQAATFLSNMRATCGPGSRLLIGVDLKKDPSVLHAAYNDADGVTAAFNLNILHRINREIGSDFDPDAFAHYAFYQPAAGRMEMHLVSGRRQTVRLGGSETARFAEGESIHTESCYKYTTESFATLVARAGYRQTAAWTDSRGWFSVQLLASID